MFGEENIIFKDLFIFGVEDFLYFLRYCEGVFYYFGCVNCEKNIIFFLYIFIFDIDEDCFIIGVMFYVKNVLLF